MIEKYYYVEPCAELNLVLNTIIEMIPCFADWFPLEEDDGYIVVKISCREEDIAYVERMIAPFV